MSPYSVVFALLLGLVQDVDDLLRRKLCGIYIIYPVDKSSSGEARVYPLPIFIVCDII